MKLKIKNVVCTHWIFLSVRYSHMYCTYDFFDIVHRTILHWHSEVYLPYLMKHTSPTTISATGTSIVSPARIMDNLCSDSSLSCKPRNCLSFVQSLKAVTKTTMKTAIRIATPSIQLASDSPCSSVDWLVVVVSSQEEKKWR